MSSLGGQDLFLQARDRFLALLSPIEQGQFSQYDSEGKLLSVEALVKEVERFSQLSSNTNLLRKCLNKINRLSKTLSPYFEVVDLITQSHPETACIIWGAFRLSLKFASNFAGFFEKLSDMLDSIALVLPQYAEIHHFWQNTIIEYPPRLKASLIQVYNDLLDFFYFVIRIFTKKDGRARSTPIVVADLFWKPFESRFKDLLERLEVHRQLVKDEMTLAVYKESKQREDEMQRLVVEERILAADAREHSRRTQTMTAEIKVLLEREHNEKMLERIKQWLAPPQFTLEFEKSKDSREPHTAEWLFSKPNFEFWRSSNSISLTPTIFSTDGDQFGEGTIWVKGNPGCGKTILAASTIEELCITSESMVYYYFFKYDSVTLDDSAAAYRSLLSQLVQMNRQDLELMDRFSFAMTKTSSGQTTASRHELVELLKMCLRARDCSFIVLDAIDECGDQDKLIRVMAELSRLPTVKIIMFSRPSVTRLSHMVRKEQQFSIGRFTTPDIKRFCETRLKDFAAFGLLPSGADRDVLIQHLATGADGMFLWARLMIDYLQSPVFSPNRRVHIIMSVIYPEKLEMMYSRITENIGKGHHVEQEMAKVVITWLLLSLRPLTVGEVRATLKASGLPFEETGDLADLEHAVIMVCTSLVELAETLDPRYAQPVRSFRFTHLSAREYFLRPNKEKNDFLAIDATSSHFKIARDCLEYMTYSLPARSLEGLLGKNYDTNDLDRMLPLCHYAALNWITHLERALSSVDTTGKTENGIPNTFFDFQDMLKRFLAGGLVLMSWIEASYTFQRIPTSQTLRRCCEILLTHETLDGSRRLSRATLSDGHELAGYLEKLDVEWGDKLKKQPSCLWEEVTSFTPSRLFQKNFATKVSSLFIDKPKSTKLGANYLSKVSEISADGLLVGVLSVWPSKEYEEVSQRNEPVDDIALLKDCCSNWIARYEIWFVSEDPHRAAEVVVSLCPEEIFQQFQQSFWIDLASPRRRSSWKIQFPTAISPDMRSFVVLRRIYSVLAESHSAPGKVESSCFLLEFNDILRSVWRRPQYGRDSVDADNHTGTQRRPLSMSSGLYLYWTVFSADGRSLFFVDNLSSEPTNFAVIEIDMSRSLSLRVTASLTVQLLQETEGSRNVSATFHPKKNLIALIVAKTVYLWPFNDASSGLVRCFCSRGFPEKLNFSSCGKFLLIKEYTSDEIKVEDIFQHIPHFEIGKKSPSPAATTSVDDTQEGPGGNQNGNNGAQPHPMLPGLEKNPPSCLTGSELSRSETRGEFIIKGCLADFATSKEFSSINPVHSKDCARLVISQRDRTGDNKIESIELSKFPRWSGIDSITTALHLPKSKSDMIKIVLNKATKRWNSITDIPVERLPAVVWRDSTSLRPPQHLSLKRNRKLCDTTNDLGSKRRRNLHLSTQTSPTVVNNRLSRSSETRSLEEGLESLQERQMPGQTHQCHAEIDKIYTKPVVLKPLKISHHSIPKPAEYGPWASATPSLIPHLVAQGPDLEAAIMPSQTFHRTTPSQVQSPCDNSFGYGRTMGRHWPNGKLEVFKDGLEARSHHSTDEALDTSKNKDPCKVGWPFVSST